LPDDNFLTRLRDAHASDTPCPDDPGSVGALLSPTLPQPFAPAVMSPDGAPDIPALPGFKDLRERGRGGLGVVYAATHVLMGRRVAVKLINAEHARHPAAVQRFRREAQAAGRLAHPNLVTAYDAGQDGDRPFLVMELIDGESLAEHLRRD